MKKITAKTVFIALGIKLLITAALLLVCNLAHAQNPLNAKAESIVGNYDVKHGGFQSKVRISKASDGSYMAQIYWVENPNDPATGKKILDERNPDKSLRNVPCDQIVLVRGLKYNAKKECWDGGKIYDPTRGINANASAEFAPDGRLKIRGSLMGFGETVYWDKAK